MSDGVSAGTRRGAVRRDVLSRQSPGRQFPGSPARTLGLFTPRVFLETFPRPRRTHPGTFRFRRCQEEVRLVTGTPPGKLPNKRRLAEANVKIFFSTSSYNTAFALRSGCSSSLDITAIDAFLKGEPCCAGATSAHLLCVNSFKFQLLFRGNILGEIPKSSLVFTLI